MGVSNGLILSYIQRAYQGEVCSRFIFSEKLLTNQGRFHRENVPDLL